MSQNLLAISDNLGNRLAIFDVGAFTILHEVPVGNGPYPVDQINSTTVLVSTREEFSAQPVDIQNGSADKVLPLSHQPRSTTAHPRKPLALIGGANQAYTSLVDTGSMTVKSIFGEGGDPNDKRRDFGGSLACGHPAWGPGDTVFHLDRMARRIEAYDSTSFDRLDSINLPSSAHHLEEMGDYFFVMCEGNQRSQIAPSVIRFEFDPNAGRIVNLVAYTLPIPASSLSYSGGHHLTVDSAAEKVYVGSADSRIFTLDANSLQLLNFTDAGPGAGHVTLCHDVDLGIVTNHNGTEMTVFDLKTGRRTGEIEVSTPRVGSKKTQGHTSKWFSGAARLVTSAAQDGKIIEVDPVKRVVTNECCLADSYLIQGTFAEI